MICPNIFNAIKFFLNLCYHDTDYLKRVPSINQISLGFMVTTLSVSDSVFLLRANIFWNSPIVNVECHFIIAGNVRACCCAGNRCSSSPTFSPIKFIKVQITNKSRKEIRLLILQVIAKKKMSIYWSASIEASPLL